MSPWTNPTALNFSSCLQSNPCFLSDSQKMGDGILSGWFIKPDPQESYEEKSKLGRKLVPLVSVHDYYRQITFLNTFQTKNKQRVIYHSDMNIHYINLADDFIQSNLQMRKYKQNIRKEISRNPRGNFEKLCNDSSNKSSQIAHVYLFGHT